MFNELNVKARSLIFSAFAVSMVIFYSFCLPGNEFTYKTSKDGVQLYENGKPVFFYQKTLKSYDGKHFFSNYIHPLYNLTGDTLTELFPADHKHHRGIFWAWHQHYIDGKSIGNGWFMNNITYDVKNVTTLVSNEKAVLKIKALWRSTEWHNNEPYIEENTTITVYKSENDVRRIDFRIELKALTEGVAIGGSADKKGYGGFCCRIKMPDDLTFTSENGKVTPQLLQINAGPWMDFSGTFGNNNEISGLTVLCSKNNPNYPQPWILRQKNSMQNVVFPGSDRIPVPTGTSIVLNYRLLIHNGNSSDIDISKYAK